MARDTRFATEREPDESYDEDDLRREEPADDDQLSLAIRVAETDLRRAQVLLDGLRAQELGDQEEADRALQQHTALKRRVNALSAQLGESE